MDIAADRHITLKYAVAVAGEPAPDCSTDGQVAEFVHGRGQILPGLENGLVGHKAGERLRLALAPIDAFGERDPALDIRVNLSDFPEEARDRLQPGVRFRGAHPKDPEQVALFTVSAREGDEVVASGNHPLAGQTLHVDCEIVAVREATPEELMPSSCCGGGSCGGGSCGEGGCGDGSCGDHEHGEGGGCGSGGCGCH